MCLKENKADNLKVDFLRIYAEFNEIIKPLSFENTNKKMIDIIFLLIGLIRIKRESVYKGNFEYAYSEKFNCKINKDEIEKKLISVSSGSFDEFVISEYLQAVFKYNIIKIKRIKKQSERVAQLDSQLQKFNLNIDSLKRMEEFWKKYQYIFEDYGFENKETDEDGFERLEHFKVECFNIFNKMENIKKPLTFENTSKEIVDLAFVLIGLTRMKQLTIYKSQFTEKYEIIFGEKLDKTKINNLIDNANPHSKEEFFNSNYYQAIFKLKILKLRRFINKKKKKEKSLDLIKKFYLEESNLLNSDLFPIKTWKYYLDILTGGLSFTKKMSQEEKMKKPAYVALTNYVDEDGYLVHGALSAVANQLNLSKERVRQLANKFEFIQRKDIQSELKVRENINKKNKLNAEIKQLYLDGAVNIDDNFIITKNARIYRIFDNNGDQVLRICKPFKSSSMSGGLLVNFNGKQKWLHIIFAEKFIDNPNNYNFVGFKDKIRYNISKENVIWIKNPAASRTMVAINENVPTYELLNLIIEHFESGLPLDYLVTLLSQNKRILSSYKAGLKDIIKKIILDNSSFEEGCDDKIFYIDKHSKCVYLFRR